MKRVLVLGVLLLSACGPGRSPDGAVDAFLSAVERGDVDTARRYVDGPPMNWERADREVLALMSHDKPRVHSRVGDQVGVAVRLTTVDFPRWAQQVRGQGGVSDTRTAPLQTFTAYIVTRKGEGGWRVLGTNTVNAAMSGFGWNP